MEDVSDLSVTEGEDAGVQDSNYYYLLFIQKPSIMKMTEYTKNMCINIFPNDRINPTQLIIQNAHSSSYSNSYAPIQVR